MVSEGNGDGTSPDGPVPSPEECLAMLAEVGVPEDVMRHIMAVTRLTMVVGRMVVGRGVPLDLDILEAGALLHDIGRCEVHSIDHGIRGATILRKRGVSEAVVGMVLRHVGAGIEAEEAASLGLPDIDLVPRTPEEKVLAGCDNLLRGDRKQTLAELKEDITEKGRPDLFPRMAELHAELCDLAGVDLDAVGIPE